MSCKTTRDGIKIYVFYHFNEDKEEFSPKTLLGAPKTQKFGENIIRFF